MSHIDKQRVFAILAIYESRTVFVNYFDTFVSAFVITTHRLRQLCGRSRSDGKIDVKSSAVLDYKLYSDLFAATIQQSHYFFIGHSQRSKRRSNRRSEFSNMPLTRHKWQIGLPTIFAVNNAYNRLASTHESFLPQQRWSWHKASFIRSLELHCFLQNKHSVRRLRCCRWRMLIVLTNSCLAFIFIRKVSLLFTRASIFP